jgi:hypothetical protein
MVIAITSTKCICGLTIFSYEKVKNCSGLGYVHSINIQNRYFTSGRVCKTDASVHQGSEV